jgi:ethanolamine utilization protein EutN
MNLARVIGTVWATRKVEHADGATIQLIQPLTGEETPLGDPIAACDTVGAGPGELVIYVTNYEAVIPFVTHRGGPGLGTLVPVDAAIVGIVSEIERVAAYRPQGGRP